MGAFSLRLALVAAFGPWKLSHSGQSVVLHGALAEGLSSFAHVAQRRCCERSIRALAVLLWCALMMLVLRPGAPGEIVSLKLEEERLPAPVARARHAQDSQR